MGLHAEAAAIGGFEQGVSAGKDATTHGHFTAQGKVSQPEVFERQGEKADVAGAGPVDGDAEFHMRIVAAGEKRSFIEEESIACTRRP